MINGAERNMAVWTCNKDGKHGNLFIGKNIGMCSFTASSVLHISYLIWHYNLSVVWLVLIMAVLWCYYLYFQNRDSHWRIAASLSGAAGWCVSLLSLQTPSQIDTGVVTGGNKQICNQYTTATTSQHLWKAVFSDGSHTEGIHHFTRMSFNRLPPDVQGMLTLCYTHWRQYQHCYLLKPSITGWYLVQTAVQTDRSMDVCSVLCLRPLAAGVGMSCVVCCRRWSFFGSSHINVPNVLLVRIMPNVKLHNVH